MLPVLLFIAVAACHREQEASKDKPLSSVPHEPAGKEVRDASGWPNVVVPPRKLPASGSVTAMAFSPDSSTLTSWNTRTQALHFHEVSTGKESRKLPYPAVTVHAIAYSPDGRSLATGDTTFSIHLWDVASGKMTKSLGDLDGSVCFALFDPKGSTLAAVASGLNVFDISTGKETFRAGGYHWHEEKAERVHGPTEWYSALAISAEGQWIASAHSGSLEGKDWDSTWTVCVWRLPQGEEVLRLQGHRGKVRAAAFSPDSKRLATVSDDRTLRVWDLEKRLELFRLMIADRGAPNLVSYFPDGKRLAVGMSSHFVDVKTDPEPGDFSLRIYDAFSGQGLAKLPAHEGGVESMAFSPDGKWLASCGMRGSIYLWEVPALTK